MTKGHDITNLPASIHDRLLGLARKQGMQYQEMLQYFAMERFLYRLSCSSHAKAFVLKGALMLRVWQIPQSRLTRDIDLLDLDGALLRLALHDELAARIVEMRFFAGMEVESIAGVLGIADRTVRRHWVYAKAWLAREMAGSSHADEPGAAP